jgi:threonine aldolase
MRSAEANTIRRSGNDRAHNDLMTKPIDLRSDTVSQPGEAMRRAMYEAEVGDDVFGDDPTVNRLEAMAAELLGKESALFVASGTMGNLIALMTHTNPGDEVLLGRESHIFQYEVGGAARIANVMVNPLENNEDGTLGLDAIAANVRAPNIHAPVTSLLCLENTHNRCGGSAISAEEMDAMAELGRQKRMRVHLDGARIFNAAVALETPAARLAEACDSVSFCLSKGLGCPIGSILTGPHEFIEKARRNRKMLGGGMRQVGVLAAAGIHALENNVQRISEDHANAVALAEGIGKYDAFDVSRPQTNIVIVDIVKGKPAAWLQAFEDAGVLAVGFGPARLRMVTHINITADDIEAALERIARAVEATPV